MKLDRRLVLAMLAPGAALAVLGWRSAACCSVADARPGAAHAVHAALGPLVTSRRHAAGALVADRAALAAWVAHRLYEAHVAAPARLADATRC